RAGGGARGPPAARASGRGAGARAPRFQEGAAMGGDRVTALGRASAEGHTLLGHNSPRPADEPQSLARVPGRCFELGEKVRTQFLELPQARQTWTAVGARAPGLWGYHHGVNEHGVAAGCSA